IDFLLFFFFQAEDGIRDLIVTGVQTCALPILGATDESARGAERDRVYRDAHHALLGNRTRARRGICKDVSVRSGAELRRYAGQSGWNHFGRLLQSPLEPHPSPALSRSRTPQSDQPAFRQLACEGAEDDRRGEKARSDDSL